MTTPWPPPPPPFRHTGDCALRNGGACSCTPRAMERLAPHELGGPRRRRRLRLRRLGSTAARWAAPWWALTWLITRGRQGKRLFRWVWVWEEVCDCAECRATHPAYVGGSDWDDQWDGIKNAGRVMVLEPGQDWKRCPPRRSDTDPVTANTGTK